MNPEEEFHILETTDWNELLKQKEALEKSGREYCDPGFGFVFAEGEVIHVVDPIGPTYSGFYHFSTQKKFLGISFTRSGKTATFKDVSLDTLKHIVRHWSPFDSKSVIDNLNATMA